MTHLQLLVYIKRAKRGRTVLDIMGQFSVSRRRVYKALTSLVEAGQPVVKTLTRPVHYKWDGKA